MEANEFICSHCGTSLTSANVDMKTRRGICPMCGCEVSFAKKHSTASPNAVLALEEGFRLFLSGNFESARTCAETAISMTEKNVAALFIVSYYKAFRAPVKNTKSLYELFNDILPDAEFDIEEEEMFKQCVIRTINNTLGFEEQLLAKFVEFDDPNELGQFVEAFCPFAINARQTYSWLTPRMMSLYLEITKRVNESNIGPLGLHGRTSVLATFVKVGPQRASGVRIVCLRPCCCFEPRTASIDL